MSLLEGFLNLLKPPGMTSHDAVSLVRRACGVKVGHTGTLDPAAAGVLLVCLGPATRLAQYCLELPKQYRGEITFGMQTDTGDADGVVNCRAEATGIAPDVVRSAVESLAGTMQQRPHAFSAARTHGRRAYELARNGCEPRLAARTVTVYSARAVRFDDGPPPRVHVDIGCSAGTYVRVLAEMVGLGLGQPATLTGLLRTAVGRFEIADAITPDRLESCDIAQLLVSPAEGLAHLPAVNLDETSVDDVTSGRRVVAPRGLADTGLVRLLRGDGSLVAVGETTNDGSGAQIRPRTVLAQ